MSTSKASGGKILDLFEPDFKNVIRWSYQTWKKELETYREWLQRHCAYKILNEQSKMLLINIWIYQKHGEKNAYNSSGGFGELSASFRLTDWSRVSTAWSMISLDHQSVPNPFGVGSLRVERWRLGCGLAKPKLSHISCRTFKADSKASPIALHTFPSVSRESDSTARAATQETRISGVHACK